MSGKGTAKSGTQSSPTSSDIIQRHALRHDIVPKVPEHTAESQSHRGKHRVSKALSKMTWKERILMGCDIPKTLRYMQGALLAEYQYYIIRCIRSGNALKRGAGKAQLSAMPSNTHASDVHPKLKDQPLQGMMNACRIRAPRQLRGTHGAASNYRSMPLSRAVSY